MKKLCSFLFMLLSFVPSKVFSQDWNFVEFPVRISSGIGVWEEKIFVPTLDTNIVGFWLEKATDEGSFRIVELRKLDFLSNVLNSDTSYDPRFRYFLGSAGGTLEYANDGVLWLVGVCAFKNYRGQDSLLYKIYCFKDGKFLGVEPVIYTKDMDVIRPLRSTRLLGIGGNNLPWLFEMQQKGDSTYIFLCYSLETADGYAFFVKDTIAYVSSLRAYFNGADVDGFGYLSYISNETLTTISPTKTIRQLRIDQMFPQIGILCGIKINKRNGHIYLFDRYFDMITYDGESWRCRRLPAIDSFPLDSRKTALVAIDSLGNVWVTMSTNFKHIYRISQDGSILPLPLPKDLTGTLSGTMQVDSKGILYFVGNRMYPDSSIKPVLFYLNTNQFSGIDKQIFTPSNNISFNAQIENGTMAVEVCFNSYSKTYPSGKIYDIQGRKIKDFTLRSEAKEMHPKQYCIKDFVDINRIVPGVYFVVVCIGENCTAKKVIVSE